MFKNLYDKRTGKRVKIYSVGEDKNGYPKFLIRNNNRWMWQSAKYYITLEERQHLAYNYYEQRLLEDYGIIDVKYIN